MSYKMTITGNIFHLQMLDIFCLKNTNYQRLNPSKTFKGYIEKHYEELKLYLIYLDNYANDFNSSTTLMEKLYRIKYDLKNKPNCVVCGKNVKFISFNKGYALHCSKECSCNDVRSKEKYKLTMYKKWLKRNPLEQLNLSEINEENDKAILTMLLTSNQQVNWTRIYSKWKNTHENYIQYVLHRFNSEKDGIAENLYRIKYALNEKPVCKVCGKPVKFVNFTKGYNNTCSHSCKSLYLPTQLKLKMTCLLRYNVDCAFKSPEIRKKIKETYDAHLKSLFFNKDVLDSPTLYSSKGEKKIFEILKPIYPDIVQYYRDPRYSNEHNGRLWECDFYIKSLDIFIEYQGFISHGSHAYNKNSEEDQKTLKVLRNASLLLKEKNGPSKNFYDDCINTWTKVDVFKRYIAKKNNLKYIEIFENYKNITEEFLLEKINDILKKHENTNIQYKWYSSI